MNIVKSLCCLLVAAACVAATALEEPILEEFLLDSDKFFLEVNVSDACMNHSASYLKAIARRESWALKMLDASTKIPEGILAYTLVHLGNFDECLMVKDVPSADGPISAQYCLVSIGAAGSGAAPYRRSFDDEERRHLEAGHRTSNLARTMLHSPMFSMDLKVALCFPASCSARDTEQLFQMVLANFTTAHVDPLDCQTAEKEHLRPKDWFAVAIFIVFVVVAVLSTAYDVLQKNAETRSNLLTAFSVYSNGKKLLATTSSGDTLHCLHGIRFVSICWVVLGHRYASDMSLAVMNLYYLFDFQKDWKRLGMTNATLSVDTFFVLSGLLVSYLFFKQVSKTKSFNVLLFYLHRYIRLTPALAFMILLQATLLMYIGSGPMWKNGATGSREACEENWWTNLLYVNNYVHYTKMCLGHTWYLAVDMQLFWLSPLVLVPLWKWPLVGKILLGALTLGGLITSFTISYVNAYPNTFFTSDFTKLLGYMQHFYATTHTRFVPYLIGIFLGYVLGNRQKEEEYIKFSRIVSLALWGCAAFCLLFSLCIMYPFLQPGYKFNVMESSSYNSLGRPLWGVGVIMVIYLCTTGHGGYVNTLLSWQVFQPLSRLSYCIYLTHLPIISWLCQTVRSNTFLGDVNVIPQFAGDMVLSIFFSVCLSLMFESPFIVLERTLLGSGPKNEPQPLLIQTEEDEDQEGENPPDSTRLV